MDASGRPDCDFARAVKPVFEKREWIVLGATTVQAILVGYAVLLVVGGLIGYRKAGSRPSLIAGSVSGAVALLAAGLMLRDGRAIWLGVVLAALMLIVFTIRFTKTRKFMPSGLLGVVSGAVLLGLLLGATT